MPNILLTTIGLKAGKLIQSQNLDSICFPSTKILKESYIQNLLEIF